MEDKKSGQKGVTNTQQQSTSNAVTKTNDSQGTKDPLKKNVGTESKPQSISSSKLSSNAKSKSLNPPYHNQIQPFLHYTNQSPDSRSHFSLHSVPKTNAGSNNNYSSTQGLYDNYGTTLTIIIILHIIYFCQWNRRTSKKDVSTSYDQLVNKKQFYTAAVALMSHPPVDGGERDAGDTPAFNWRGSDSSDNITQNGVNGDGLQGNNVNGSSLIGASRDGSSSFSNIYQSVHRITQPLNLIVNKILRPLLFGSLSGLPLLAYVSHILWQCRALEELYDEHDGKLILASEDQSFLTKAASMGTGAILLDQSSRDSTNNTHLQLEGFTYFRVLVALAVTSVLLEVNLLRSILRRAARMVDLDGLALSGPHSPYQILSQRAMCSFASLAAAILMVYDSQFPHAPPPVLPFIRVPFLSSSGFSLLFSLGILAALGRKIHPISSVISGMLSASLWSLGVTKFLATQYWGNVMIYVIVAAFLVSLKASRDYSAHLGMFFPCLDYVAWDEQGKIEEQLQNQPRRNSSRMRDQNSDDDLELGTSGLNSERMPLFSQTSSSSMSSGVSSSAIRGRIPLNSIDSDLSDNGNSTTMPAASSRFGGGLSRRGGGN